VCSVFILYHSSLVVQFYLSVEKVFALERVGVLGKNLIWISSYQNNIIETNYVSSLL